MLLRRLLAVVVACWGLEAACSSVGPLDGEGGAGGLPLPTGQWDGPGGGAMDPGGAWGGAGKPAASGGGGGGGTFNHSLSELSCLKPLFASCPTIAGSCHYGTGSLGSDGGGGFGSGGSSGINYCFDNGVTVAAMERACPASSVGWDNEWVVRNPDGSVCYVISRVCACDCDTEVVTVRDGSGAVVGAGSNAVSSTGVTVPFTCNDGDACQDSFCTPFVRYPSDACATGACP